MPYSRWLNLHIGRRSDRCLRCSRLCSLHNDSLRNPSDKCNYNSVYCRIDCMWRCWCTCSCEAGMVVRRADNTCPRSRLYSCMCICHPHAYWIRMLNCLCICLSFPSNDCILWWWCLNLWNLKNIFYLDINLYLFTNGI